MPTFCALFALEGKNGPLASILWPERIRYAWDPNKKLFSSFDLDFFESKIGKVLPLLYLPMASERLGQVVEGGGKQRIFTIGNYINQRLLKLVHDWLMEVLACIPMDDPSNNTS